MFVMELFSKMFTLDHKSPALQTTSSLVCDKFLVQILLFLVGKIMPPVGNWRAGAVYQ